MAPLQAILEKHRTHPPNILATLQAVQLEHGYVDPSNVPLIAQALGVTDSDVHGVLGFYHDLRTEPPGRHQIRFCLGDSCIAMKAEKSARRPPEESQVRARRDDQGREVHP